ncbi:MAG: DUF427 domain-containing protein [Pseudomonadota bacterium]
MNDGVAAMRPIPDRPARGQESAWDFPRPAIAEPTSLPLQVKFGGALIAETIRGVRTLETSHPPTYYFPLDAVKVGVLAQSGHGSFCEWKGEATYFDVAFGTKRVENAAWTYLTPTPAFEILQSHIAFYASVMDACFVDGECVQPQPGGFYGGWITSHFAGPFKGEPGSFGW